MAVVGRLRNSIPRRCSSSITGALVGLEERHGAEVFLGEQERTAPFEHVELVGQISHQGHGRRASWAGPPERDAWAGSPHRSPKAVTAATRIVARRWPTSASAVAATRKAASDHSHRN